MEKVLSKQNMIKALREVKKNKRALGIGNLTIENLNLIFDKEKGIFNIFESIIKEKVFKVEDDIDTDQIYPGRYLYLTSPEEMAVHVMEDAVLSFYKKIEGEDWIIVAGKNFGCGSSREHAPRALLYAGIKAVVAAFFIAML
jgi:aconitase A